MRSYRDLPLILYHFQTKERDEPRPRAGVLRTREFIMKDSYTFDRDAEGLQAGYEKHIGAYERIFDRAGLRWYLVESDVGMMGGTRAHEYMAPCPAGEDDVALAPGYAANVEVASAEPQPVALPEPEPAPRKVHTPGATTIDAVAGQLGVPAGALLKAFPIVTEGRGLRHGRRARRPPRQRDEAHERARRARSGRRARARSPSASARPASSAPSARRSRCSSTTPSQSEGGWVAGANEPDHHLAGVQPGRDFAFERATCAPSRPATSSDGQPITIEPAIEIGNIFQLGTRYSEPLGATYLDEIGQGAARVDGLLRHRPRAHRRRRGRAVRRRAGHLVAALARAVGRRGRRPGQAGQRRAGGRRGAARRAEGRGLDALLDDRDAGTGEKFADAELLGVPLRLTVGKRSLAAGTAEAQIRRGLQDVDGGVPLTGGAEAVRALWADLP